MSSLNGEVTTCDQGIGESLQLRIYGDEFYARRETLSGYTVVYDTDCRCYCFATLAAGRFVSTGIPNFKPAPASIRRHLKEDPDVRNELFSLRYAQLRPVEHIVGSSSMRTLGPDDGLLSGRKLHRGQVKGLTVLVDFDDVRSLIAAADVDAMFNADDYSENGNFCSVKKYFEIISSGKLTYTNLVAGPVRLSKRRSHYINNSLVKEAMDLVVNDLGIDLKQFDSKNENIVDAINFLYAGESQYSGDLWPHNHHQTHTYGNMRTHYYQLTGLGMHRVDLRIGTICHENGHLLCRFPDMYDYGKRDGDHEKSQGIGRYCLMGSGNHLNHRRTPAAVCGYLRELAGWVDQVIDLNNPGSYTTHHGQYNTVMKFGTDKANEYFIVENRTQMGLDTHLPSSGLAVFHCDTLGSNEWQEGTRNKHYQCALLQADGHLDLENNRNPGDSGDLFQAAAGVALSNTSTPSSREWDGTDSGLMISNIGPPGQSMDFVVGQGFLSKSINAESFPNLIIPDKDAVGISDIILLGEHASIDMISVNVEIIHSWISDLTVALHSPDGTRVLLHDREGGNGDDIHRSWKSDNHSSLQKLMGENTRGNWRLHVVDHASQDKGRLLSWGLALEVTSPTEDKVEGKAEPNVTIPDFDAAGIVSTIAFSQSGRVQDIEVGVDIGHSYIGDLQVELVSPSGLSIRLHNRQGDWRNDIKRTYDVSTTPSLQSIVGESVRGDWLLRVRDLARRDEGQLNAWSLIIHLT